MDIVDSCFMMIMECHLWQCIGSIDSITWSADTMIFTGCRCQTSRFMYADTPIAAIWQLLLMYVVPILVGLKIVDISLYNQFVCGKSSKPLMDIYKDSDKGEWLATRLLNRNEAFEVEEGKSVVTVEQKIQQLYDAIFVTEYTGNVYHTILGEYEFDDNSKNFVKSVESMLSVYADYNI